MTKQKRAVTLNPDLDAAIGMLAIKNKMSYSGFLESRLREIPEIFNEIKRQRALPDDPTSMGSSNLQRVTREHDEVTDSDVKEIPA